MWHLVAYCLYFLSNKPYGIQTQIKHTRHPKLEYCFPHLQCSLPRTRAKEVKSPRPCSFSPQYSSKPSSESACTKDKLFERHTIVKDRILLSKNYTVPHLEFQSDLKSLVGVLQGFKGHVRVTIKPGKVQRYH